MTSLAATPPAEASAERAMRDSCSRLLPGQLFGGKYRIESRVAEGGMGVVLKATHIDLECAVAIKIIRPEHAENEDFVARLLSEARIAASLRSKHVNRVLDVGRTNSGVPYLVLEYMEGSDLACHLERNGRFSPNDAVDCVMQACEALAEAHATDIVHRDLKPENLFLSEEADGSLVLKVLDFGISKGPARRGGRALTNPWEVVGTPSYMAPEQIRGTDVVDGRADIWALGIILYELCTCQTPFDAEAVPDVFALVLGGLPSSFKMEGHVPAGLQAVIRKCLRTNADERYQSVVELAEALAPFGNDAVQAGRVAKVATTTTARILAMQGSSDRSSSGPSAGTPLALAITKLDSQKAVSWQRRRGPNFKLIGLAAALPFALAFGYLASRAANGPSAFDSTLAMHSPVPAAQAPGHTAPAPAPAASVAETTRPVELVPAFEAASDTPRKPRGATMRYGLTAKTPGASVSSAGLPKAIEGSSAKSTATSLASAAPTTAALKPDQPASDAWNPKSFGGRR